MAWDYIELAARMLGMTEQQYEALENSDESEYEKIDEMLCDKYEVSLDAFSRLVRDLLPMTMPQQAAISGELKHVIGVFSGDNNEYFRSIVECKSTLQCSKNG